MRRGPASSRCSASGGTSAASSCITSSSTQQSRCGASQAPGANGPSLPTLRCQEGFFPDSYALECVACSNTAKAMSPLMAIGAIVTLVSAIVAWNYKWLKDFYNREYEWLLMISNHATLLVRERFGVRPLLVPARPRPLLVPCRCSCRAAARPVPLLVPCCCSSRAAARAVLLSCCAAARTQHARALPAPHFPPPQVNTWQIVSGLGSAHTFRGGSNYPNPFTYFVNMLGEDAASTQPPPPSPLTSPSRAPAPQTSSISTCSPSSTASASSEPTTSTSSPWLS